LDLPPKVSLLQALRHRRMVAILLLGAASGLPFNLTLSTLQAWLAESKVDIRTIGFFGLAGLPYTVKFLWAPLLDRYLPPLLGRRRGWIVIFQAALALAIGVMSLSEPARMPAALGAIAFIVVFLSASQDIVINAYCVDVLPADERALASAVTGFGFRSAAMFAGTVTVFLAAYIGWHIAYGIVAVLMATTILGTLWAPEPLTPGLPPRTLAAAVVLPLRDLLQRPGATGFLLLALLYKVGDAFALSLYSAFMIRGVHISLQELSIAGKLNMTISSMVGTALGGWVYLRWGLYRSLLTFGIAQALTNLLYMALALAGNQLWLVIVATSVDNLAGGMGLAAFTAFLMAQCSIDFSATQYALLSAISALPRVVMQPIAGFVVDRIGWANFFVVTFLTAIPGLVLLVLLRTRIRDLDAREKANAVASR
jgi:PAT family beta-lactamase induction signal transducer AmpG